MNDDRIFHIRADFDDRNFHILRKTGRPWSIILAMIPKVVAAIVTGLMNLAVGVMVFFFMLLAMTASPNRTRITGSLLILFWRL